MTRKTTSNSKSRKHKPASIGRTGRASGTQIHAIIHNIHTNDFLSPAQIEALAKLDSDFPKFLMAEMSKEGDTRRQMIAALVSREDRRQVMVLVIYGLMLLAFSTFSFVLVLNGNDLAGGMFGTAGLLTLFTGLKAMLSKRSLD